LHRSNDIEVVEEVSTGAAKTGGNVYVKWWDRNPIGATGEMELAIVFGARMVMQARVNNMKNGIKGKAALWNEAAKLLNMSGKVPSGRSVSAASLRNKVNELEAGCKKYLQAESGLTGAGEAIVNEIPLTESCKHRSLSGYLNCECL
jgi:hypothetical protein